MAPPAKRIKIPNPPRMRVIRMSFCRDRIFSSTSINWDTRTELNKMATIREEPNTTDSVMGK